MALIKFKRGTRAQLDAAATANELNQGEPYYVTDDETVVIGTAVDSAVDLARLSGPQQFSGHHRFVDGVMLRSADESLWVTAVSDLGVITASPYLERPACPDVPSMPTVIANGATYYVSADTGSDTHSAAQAQSRDTPWASLDFAILQLSAGDTLVVIAASSPYPMSYRALNGSASAWYRIVGEDGARATLTGAVLYSSSYIEIANLNLSPTGGYSVAVHRGASNLFFHDIECNGNDVGQRGFFVSQNVNDSNVVNNIFFQNVSVHDCTNEGFLLENSITNLIFDSVDVYNCGGDGFSGRSLVTEDVAPSENFYFVDCSAFDNGGDGFDIGCGGIQLIKDCTSYSNGLTGLQGVGFKLWGGIETGGAVWLYGCKAWGNAQSAVHIKNLIAGPINLISNVFCNNEVEGGGVEIMVVNVNNDTEYMGDPDIRLVDNVIYATGGPIFACYNDDALVTKSFANVYASNADLRFLEIRDASMTVTDYIMLGSTTSSELASMYYTEALPEKTSLFLTGKSTSDIFVDAANNDYTVKAGVKPYAFA